MHVQRFHDRDAFAQRVEPFLLRHEAENCFFLGLIAHLAQINDKVLLVAEDAGEVLAVATMTPPRHMVITRAPRDAVFAVVDHLLGHGIDVPGIGGRRRSAEAFAERWTRATGTVARLHMEMLTHELTAVTPPRAVAGAMRWAGSADLDLVTRWVCAFRESIGESHITDSRELAEQRVAAKQIALWDLDDTAVAMAGMVGPTPNGIRIVLVYTPPEHRQRGYASNLVAALSQHQLDAGKRLCFLNTDVANLTANKIYAAIGYRPVCETIQIMFDRPGNAR
jgi:predicted GNAT family acetyltransferase